MNDFITLKRGHPDFERALLGGLDKKIVPVPVKSLNVNQRHEEVTFQLLPVDKIEKPNILYTLGKIFRLELLALTFIPAITTLAILQTPIEKPGQIILAFVVLFLLHAGFFCRNDYIDHMHGVDRLNEKSGSQVIQKGWLRASQVRQLYIFIFVLAFVCALPFIMSEPKLLALASAVGLLGVLGYGLLRWGRLHWIFGELAIWLCLGPFITCGVHWAAGKSVGMETILFGSFFGLLAVVYVELRRIACMIVDYEARLFTMPVRLGFDGAKKAILFMIFILICQFATITTHLLPDERSILGLPVVIFLVYIAKKIFTLKSPLSSTLYGLPQLLLMFYYVVGGFFLFIYIL